MELVQRMVSTEKMKIEMLKLGLGRETFCKKMWMEIEKKRCIFREDVKKYTERLNIKRRKKDNRNKRGERI